MQTVFKYPLNTNPGAQVVLMPANHKILSVAMIAGQLVMYAIVDTETDPIGKIVNVVFTGWPIPFDVNRNKHIGTVEMGWLVYHVFTQTS